MSPRCRRTSRKCTQSATSSRRVTLVQILSKPLQGLPNQVAQLSNLCLKTAGGSKTKREWQPLIKQCRTRFASSQSGINWSRAYPAYRIRTSRCLFMTITTSKIRYPPHSTSIKHSTAATYSSGTATRVHTRRSRPKEQLARFSCSKICSRAARLL